MKQIIIQLMLFALIYTSAIAQDCPPQNVGKTPAQYEALIKAYCEDGNGINTNPANLQNPACPDLKNDFEWRIKQDPSTVSVNPEYYIVYDESGNPVGVRNPFNDPGNHEYSHIDNNHNSNYQPEDGWELLKVDFGALSNFNTGWDVTPQNHPGLNPNLGGKKLPYMILYNKYTGTFRFFGTLLGQMQDYETVRIELRIPEKSPNHLNTGNKYQDLKATNLLSIQGDAVQPLDQETDENVMVVFAKATNNSSQFFWFDIPVAYDPCLCNIRSQLDITFAFVKTGYINLNGIVNGAIKTEPKPDNTPKGVKVATTVIAAGVSTVLAVKTGGAVINFQAYSDLVKLLKDIPGLSSAQKDDLEALSNYVDCGLKFAKVIKNDFKDVTASGGLTEVQKKAKYKAANNILDANTTFLTSLANGCEKKDNAATTINATVNLSGTWTETTIPGNTEILMAIPGSNWTDFEMDRVPYTLNDKTVPSYPAYNERLGTFALLETPELLALDLSMINYSIIRLKLNSDIKYAFNPIMNIDKENTAIFCRIVSSSDHHVTPPTLSNPYFDQHCNIIIDNNSLYKISSPFVPIDYFENTHIRFVSDKPFSTNYADYLATLKIQFKILFQSKNIGKDNKPNSSILIYTFPLNINHQVVTSYDPESPYYDLLTEYPLYNIIQETKKFDVDETFVDDEIIVYDNIVEINANLSTLPGKKVIIYSTMGFEVSPNSEISPDIELRIGYPFTKQVQPEQSYTQIESFCSNPDKYKASTFSNLAKTNEAEVYKHRIESKNSNKENLSFSIYPNPNNGLFNIKFSKPAEPGTIIELTDLTGKLVYTEVLNTQIIDKLYNFSDLTTGAYFVTVKSMYGKSVQKVIVY